MRVAVRWAGLVVAVLLALPAASRAAAFRSGDEVLIPAGETVADDLYVAAGRVRIEGAVSGDLVVFAGELDLRGPVGGDLLAAAGQVRVDGSVADSARIAAGEVTLVGSIGEDLVAATGNLFVGPAARIGRDLAAAGGAFEGRGAVGRHARIAAGRAILAGSIGGDVDAEVEELDLEASARIGGRLAVTSAEAPRLAPGSTVAGGIERLEPEHRRPSPGASWAYRFLRGLVAFFVLGLVVLALTRAGTARAVAATRDAPLRDLAVGLAFVVAGPIAFLLVFLLGLPFGGWWIGLLLAGLYGAILAAGIPVVALALGRALLARLRPGAGAGIALFLGAVLVALAGSIPGVGFALVLVAAAVGAGAWIVVFATARTRHLPPAAVPARGDGTETP